MQRAPGDSTALPALRDDYPHFRIWRETSGTRIRYIARRLIPGAHPLTVVTAGLSELRAELAAGAAMPAPTPEP
jgi:hypothetical protein